MVTKTPAELEEMQMLIDRGELPKDAIKQHFDAEARNVFGHDAKKDRKGHYQEQGLGSPGNQTRNSVEAYKRYCKDDPDYTETLKRMEAELAASNDKRKKAAA